MDLRHIRECTDPIECDNFEAHMRYPWEPRPELPYMDSDWMRNYYNPADYNEEKPYLTPSKIWEIHELVCHPSKCAFEDGPCAFHPMDCTCCGKSGECERIYQEESHGKPDDELLYRIMFDKF